MKVELILIGKTVNSHFNAGINDYLERTNHYLPFKITVIPDIKNTKNFTEEQQKIKEGEEILKHLKPSDTVVLLDEHGKEFRSLEFATWIQKNRIQHAILYSS